MGSYNLLSIINNLKNENKETPETPQNEGNYFSWPKKKDVKKFLECRKKYVDIRDFFSLVFYNPKNF